MTYRSDGGAAGPSTVLGEGLLVGVGALGGVGNAVLGLPEFGQIYVRRRSPRLSQSASCKTLSCPGAGRPGPTSSRGSCGPRPAGSSVDLPLRLAHVLLDISHAPVLSMGLQDLALPLEALSKVLLAAEFNGQPGGIDRSTLGLLLAEGCLTVAISSWTECPSQTQSSYWRLGWPGSSRSGR